MLILPFRFWAIGFTLAEAVLEACLSIFRRMIILSLIGVFALPVTTWAKEKKAVNVEKEAEPAPTRSHRLGDKLKKKSSSKKATPEPNKKRRSLGSMEAR